MIARSRRRPLVLSAWIAAAIIVLAVAGLFAGGFYYSSLLKREGLTPDYGAPTMDVVITGVTDSTAELRSSESPPDTGSLSRQGTWGLAWDGGYGQVSAVIASTGDHVTRTFRAFGAAPAPGTAARFDENAFPPDPFAALGLAFEDVSFQSDLGTFGAWLTPATPGSTWLVFVHGRDADQSQGLRLLEAVHPLGITALLISYRNDQGAPGNPDGLRHYGATEWAEVEGAVRFAVDHGAQRIVLAGYSMGGSAIMAFMERSALASRVEALILDAPVLDFGATVDFQAGQRNAPSLLTGVGKWIAARRFDLDWGEMDYLEGAEALNLPILLFHGTADDETPIAESERLAALHPDSVTFVRVEGAGHVRSWNTDPAAYRAAIVSFLEGMRRDQDGRSARPDPERAPFGPVNRGPSNAP